MAVIDQTPGPMIVVQPTVEMGKRWSKGRFAPLIEETQCLKSKVKDPRSRDSGNSVQSKEFSGGTVVVTGALSPVGLRSMPVKYLFLDKVDALHELIHLRVAKYFYYQPQRFME